jgi:hypothetical protein
MDAGSSRFMVSMARSGQSARFALAFAMSRAGTTIFAPTDRRAGTVSTPIPE